MSELSYKDEAVSAYDRAFVHVSTHFLPFLLRAGRLERPPGPGLSLAGFGRPLVNFSVTLTRPSVS
jgi:hypothetical protein